MKKLSRLRRGVMPRLAACAVALAAAAAVAATVTAPANAAVTVRAVPSAVTAPALGHTTPGGVTELSFIKGSARVTIECKMVFIGDDGGVPHHSGHVPGTINVRVRVTCTAPVARIKGKIGLFSSTGSKIKNYGSVGVRTARGNAALVCTPGFYVGSSSATVTAPPGFSPHTATLTDQTKEVHIKKC
jgi:hypothetical protein